MAKTSLDLRKTLSVSAFFHLAREIAIDYANSAASTARTALSAKHDITESTFYTLIELSITHSLVSDKTVQSIFEKTLANLSVHGNNGYNSKIKHQELLEKRKNYSAFRKKDIAYIARYYANHPELSKAEVANFFCFINTKPLDQILQKACVELIISDTVFKALWKRAIDNSTPKNMDRTVQFFIDLQKQRTSAKKSKKAGHSAF
jgi:hypothetical protein